MNRTFKWTICDPLVPAVIEKGRIAREAVLPAFRDFPWQAMLAKQRSAKQEEVHFSPSVGFTNLDDGHSLDISIVEDERDTVFYLFFAESANESSRLDLLDQSAEATIDILADFADGRYDHVLARFESANESAPRESKPWWKVW